MANQVFIWVAHPGQGSFCGALADAYEAAARRAGAEVRRQDLSDMQVSLAGFAGYRDMPALEPDLVEWQDNLRWADHILVVHPYWWGGMPAAAKAVFDRALLPGLGFRYHRKGVSWDRLLTGKTADIMVTSDTPPWLDTLLYWQPARRVLKAQILGFCGIRTRRSLQFGSVKTAGPERRQRWLQRAARLGAKRAALPAGMAAATA